MDPTTLADEVTALSTQLNNRVEIYKEVTQTQIPSTLKQALAQKWELSVNAVEFDILMAYAASQQKIDHRRVIKVERVLTILEDYEEAVIKASTNGFFKSLYNLYAAKLEMINIAAEVIKTVTIPAIQLFFDENSFYYLLTNLPTVIATIWGLVSTTTTTFALLLLKLSSDATTIEVYVGNVKRIIAARALFESRLRSSAFPHRIGKRYIRRKETR